ncbi:MAG TPA: RNA-binding protein [Stellaceae bacterium]|nr:RNA-binding protein [Stellaceae bacterium]
MVRRRTRRAAAGVAATALDTAEAAGGPQRRCIATGEIGERALLLRFVVGPGGEIVPDLAARLPGRGLWLAARRDIVEWAVAKRLFARAARRTVSVPPEFADRLEALLAQRCVEAVGLARRAGLAVAGFEKVREAVRTGKSALLLAALDGAEGGRRKLAALAHDLPLAVVLSAVELGGAFGREHVVQAAVGRGALSDRLAADAKRIAGFRATAAVHSSAAGLARG